MPEEYDIDGFLQNGYWHSSRNHTPDHRFSSYTAPVDPVRAPRYAHTTDTPPGWPPSLYPPAPIVEDEADSLAREYHTATLSSFHPPPPTVEDEAESLAKEHGSVISAPTDEQPKNPGDVDQVHVLELVPEHNPERRFVFQPSVSVSSEAKNEVEKAAQAKRDGDKDDDGSQLGGKETYEANTRRKYVPITPEEEEEEEAERRRERGQRGQHNGAGRRDERDRRNGPDWRNERDERDERDRRANRERRKSRLEDLPTIVTDFGPNSRDERRRSDIRRAKSATGRGASPEDYFSPRRNEQTLRDESMLGPNVIKHSTKGRERAYHDYGGYTSPNQSRVRPSKPDDQYDRRSQRRNDDNYYPTSPVDPRKSFVFDNKSPRDERPRDGRKPSKEDSIAYDRDYGKNDKGRSYPDAPPKLSRKDSSSSRSRPERESLRPRSGSFRGKDEPPPSYKEPRHSSDEDADRRGTPRRRGKSFREDRNGFLTTPLDGMPPGYRSKPSSPLPSPRTSQDDFSGRYQEREPSRSPRTATFPYMRDLPKSDSRYPVKEERSEPPSSRSPVGKSVHSSTPSISVPIIAGVAAAAATAAGASTAEPNSPVHRQSMPSGPPPSKGRVINDPRTSARSSSSTVSTSPPRQSWQPPKFDPVKDGVQTDQPVTSYRRYSQGFSHDDLPDLPDCPRTKEEAGHMDWLTLPKCNNFNICPSCYEAAFGNTELRNSFVPAPFRPQDRPIKCDFGASTWYHIAWLLTHKYQQPDLRLFQGLVSVAKAHQPCSGLQPAYRTWYTIKDPVTQRPVPTFNICHNCARNIEVLLPNLAGVFVPRDLTLSGTKGTCDMHQHGFSGDRKRFVAYFDLMETASDKALFARSSPDIRELADRIRELSLVEECFASQPVADRKWYTMRSVPDCTVCEECFNEVIWPEIERDRSGVATEFYKNPQKLSVAACQLYSLRMRNAFQKAVDRNDLDAFESALRRRQRKEREFHDKIRSLDPNVVGAEWVDEEVDRLKREWRRYE